MQEKVVRPKGFSSHSTQDFALNMNDAGPAEKWSSVPKEKFSEVLRKTKQERCLNVENSTTTEWCSRACAVMTFNTKVNKSDGFLEHKRPQKNSLKPELFQFPKSALWWEQRQILGGEKGARIVQKVHYTFNKKTSVLQLLTR